MKAQICFMLIIAAMPAANATEEPSLEISVTGVDGAALKCGITDADIRSNATAALVARGIQVPTATATNPWLHISINTLYLEPVDVCISSVSVQLLGATERDEVDSPIGKFHSKSRLTQLSSSESVLTRKKSAGFARLLIENVEMNVNVTLGKVTF
jgi:hypothetical protein